MAHSLLSVVAMQSWAACSEPECPRSARRGATRQPRLRDDRVLMVRERGPVAEGRHLGQEYWTLPRGGTPARREPRSCRPLREHRPSIWMLTSPRTPK